MIEYFANHYDDLLGYLFQHLYLCSLAFLISLFIAIPLGILAAKVKGIAPIFNAVFNFIFSIPSMAMFALFIPLFGLGDITAVLVVALYNQIILIRSIVDGFNSVDPIVLEAAKGMGMKEIQIFLQVEVPLAMPAFCTGIRLAILSTISMTTLAASINAGGIGRLLFDGLRMMYFVKIYWGAILAASLALVASLILKKVEKIAMETANGEREITHKRKKY